MTHNLYITPSNRYTYPQEEGYEAWFQGIHFGYFTSDYLPSLIRMFMEPDIRIYMSKDNVLEQIWPDKEQ